MINAERNFMFSACAGVSSIASHTLAKRFLLIDLVPLTNPGNAARPGSDPLCSFSAPFFGNNAARKRHHRTSPHAAQASVLKKAAESSVSVAIADARLQRLLLGTNSGPLLQAGMQEDIHVINVMDFVRAGETAVQGFTAMYEFLCDVSHPTYMHSFLYWLRVDASWSNDHNAREMHRILEKVPKAAEMAIGGTSTVMIEIYDECVPDLEKEITSYHPWTNTNVDQEPTA